MEEKVGEKVLAKKKKVTFGKGLKKTVSMESAEESEFDEEKYQDLLCYYCGKSTPGKMTICVNKNDPDRDDDYGRNGYTAAC